MPDRLQLQNIFGEHALLLAAMDLVAKVAPTRSTVLLLGETGTGKEVIARAIHAWSPRHAGPFVAVDCASIPEALLESELFGHERGAFTGAVNRTIGLAERANGGTLFLDEIGELPLPLQPKLLRLLQEREATRVGGSAPIAIDARIVVATHRDLAALCAQGLFRPDLFWRLNVFPLTLPRLQDRNSDVPLLATEFLRRLALDGNSVAKTLSPDALAAMRGYRWPGNVRELRAAMERASVLTSGDVIGLDDLTPAIREVEMPADGGYRIPESGFDLDRFEKDLILQALARCDGVIARAARMLGMSYRKLHHRLARYTLLDRV